MENPKGRSEAAHTDRSRPDRDEAQAAASWREPDLGGWVDLHVHTTASDGSESPRRLFEMARERGLAALGFCDHDSQGSVAEGLALAEEFGIELVPGCEIGIAHDPERGLVETDILAYYYDPAHDELNAVLQRLQVAKNKKLDLQLARLAEDGLRVPREEVLAGARGETIRRPHIYQVLRKYHPEITPEVFYPSSDFGGRWYVSKEFSLSLEDCVALVRRAGGVTCLSSPGSYNALYKKSRALVDPAVDRMVEVCAAAGVECLETIYSYHRNKPYYRSAGETISAAELHALIDHFEALARRHGLTPTGGSDFHGTAKPQIALGEVAVPYRYLTGLKRAAGRL